MNHSADPPCEPEPPKRTLPVEDLPISSPGEATIAPADAPAPLPPDLGDPPRGRLPPCKKGPVVEDPTPSEAIDHEREAGSRHSE